jgi:hypothetical protein
MNRVPLNEFPQLQQVERCCKIMPRAEAKQSQIKFAYLQTVPGRKSTRPKGPAALAFKSQKLANSFQLLGAFFRQRGVLLIIFVGDYQGKFSEYFLGNFL